MFHPMYPGSSPGRPTTFHKIHGPYGIETRGLKSLAVAHQLTIDMSRHLWSDLFFEVVA
jgi:hypothetical protein